MERPRAALWLPLLVILLGGSFLARSPDRAWPHALLPSMSVGGTPDEYYLRADPERHHAIDARPREDHQSHARSGLLPARSTASVHTHQQFGRLRYRDPDTPPRQAGQYPLFSTGPPSHT